MFETHTLRLTEAQGRTAEQLEARVNWQRGEAGRREGERDERDIESRMIYDQVSINC